MRTACVIGTAILVAGCGGDKAPPLGPAAGTVTLDGAPLTAGVVTFESRERGFAGSGELSSDGSFRIRSQYGDGLPTGRYKVSVSPPPSDDPTRPGAAKQPPASAIPAKYHSPDTSGLEADVQPGAAPFKFELKRSG